MYLGKLSACTCWVASLLTATTVQACPFCDTSVGQRVRAGIWDENFWHNVLLTVLPFVVFAVIIALLRFGIPPGRRVKAVATVV